MLSRIRFRNLNIMIFLAAGILLVSHKSAGDIGV